MTDYKSISTPIVSNYLHEGELDQKYESFCRSLIGALLYISLCSRPVTVNILSRSQHKANINLWNALKRVLIYLKGTANLCLVHKKIGDDFLKLKRYADADWGGDKVTRRSTSGYIFQLNGCSVVWQTKRQNSVFLSTEESEYISLSEACIDIV